jgi:hypothetical protein
LRGEVEVRGFAAYSKGGDIRMNRARVFAAVFWAWGTTATGFGSTLLVGPGEEYWTIRSAINAATSGDIVQVAAGEYVENITLKEGVEVVGGIGGETIIRSLTESSPFAAVRGKDNSTLRGFTVTGGYYGIRCDEASPTILDCVIWRNSSSGISIESSSPTIGRCVIAQNPLYGVESLGTSAPDISNCTFSANGYGVFGSASSDPALTNCILWDNWDDLEGVDNGTSVSHCDIEDGDFAGTNGNIATDPGFVAWGDFDDSENALHVDVGHTGTEQGTRENPFSRMSSALSVHSYHLGIGSPCLDAGSGGVHMGAYPDEEASTPSGNTTVMVNVAAGTYYESRLFVCHGAKIRGSETPPSRVIAFGDTVFFVLGESSVEKFSISGGDDAIACFFAEASVSDCLVLECGQNAVYCFGSNASIQRCEMFFNSNAGVFCMGGSAAVSDCFIGEHGSTGIICEGASTVTVTNCAITESAVGLSCANGSILEVHNSTVTNSDWKGMIAGEGGSVSVVNSIIWGNPFGDLSAEGGTFDVTFSDVGGGIEGEGNIDENPLFERGALGEFYLDSDSRCIDGGNAPAETLGLNGKTTQPTGEPDAGIVDMGYHYEGFRVDKATGDGGQLTLEWNSTVTLDYGIYFSAEVETPVSSWDLIDEVTASWMKQRYTLDIPSAPAGFYRIARR